MPSTSLEFRAAWSNYHVTIGDAPQPGEPPAMSVEFLRRLHASDLGDLSAEDAMKASAATLIQAMNQIDLERLGNPSPIFDKPQREFASGMVGRGWSFSGLIGTPVSQIITEGLSWTKELPETMRTPQAKNKRLVVCGGGTRLRELVTWAERAMGCSIPTSGTHLGPTIAGGFGTASHGSRLGLGGLQNLVRGMHIVTGAGEHVFIQREAYDEKKDRGSLPKINEAEHFPVLSEAAIKGLETRVRIENPPQANGFPGGFVDRDFQCRIITSDEHFENALIHLGCMGVVCSVVLELTAIEDFSVMRWAAPIDTNWLTSIDRGEWQALADKLGAGGRKPQFYELTIDPFKPLPDPADPKGDVSPAAHLFYFIKDTNKDLGRDASLSDTRPVPANAVAGVARSLLSFSQKGRTQKDGSSSPFIGLKDGSPEPDVTAAIEKILKFVADLFKAYLISGQFKAPEDDDFDRPHQQGTWSQIHTDEITGDVPGALYNASYAIPRSQVSKAVPLISKAVQGLDPSFVFTLRFISKPAGTLAFTQEEETAIIEIDGLSPFICHRTIFEIKKHLEESGEGEIEPRLEAALLLLASTLERGADAVREALKDAGIPFSMHWAKLGNLDGKKVQQDFGPTSPKGDRIKAWQATRQFLLSPNGQTDENLVFFRNKAVVKYGLVDPLADEEWPDVG